MQRVCVIGLGPIGNRHADLHAENPLAELVGVCDIVIEMYNSGELKKLLDSE